MPNIEAVDHLTAWQEGVRMLRANHGELFSLITQINNPASYDPAWLTDFSPSTIVANADRAIDVVQTIFPINLQSRHSNRVDIYEHYLRLHQRARKWPRNRSRWGTYFERLISFNGQKNQLEIAIQKLLTWPRNTTGLVFHLSCPLVDSPRTRGAPCWHFGELVWKKDETLDFVVVYRNHDFFNKALSNFIALGQLQKFICAETNKQPGALICHSVHAYSEESMQKLSTLANI